MNSKWKSVSISANIIILHPPPPLSRNIVNTHIHTPLSLSPSIPNANATTQSSLLTQSTVKRPNTIWHRMHDFTLDRRVVRQLGIYIIYVLHSHILMAQKSERKMRIATHNHHNIIIIIFRWDTMNMNVFSCSKFRLSWSDVPEVNSRYWMVNGEN